MCMFFFVLYILIYGDLINVNILVENGNFMGIFDWEVSGYFLVWWEFICVGISLGVDDLEWKIRLCKYMFDYMEV